MSAFNSIAIRDTFDGVDKPMVVFEAKVSVAIEVSAVIVTVGASGGITVTVEVDIFDPFPETSGGLVYPFEVSDTKKAYPFTVLIVPLSTLIMLPFQLPLQ